MTFWEWWRVSRFYPECRKWWWRSWMKWWSNMDFSTNYQLHLNDGINRMSRWKRRCRWWWSRWFFWWWRWWWELRSNIFNFSYIYIYWNSNTYSLS
jgi:hypothetical protein